MKKNFYKIPKWVTRKLESIENDCIKVGAKVLIDQNNIDRFQPIGLKIENGKLIHNDYLVPPKNNGRYSKYNREGRIITRKDLPKVEKTFWIEFRPYGNPNADYIEVPYERKVFQKEEWIPQYYKIEISTIQKQADSTFLVLFEMQNILVKNSNSFNEELLFFINIMQENIGTFDVYSDSQEPETLIKREYFEWEFLPPGKLDRDMLQKFFGKKTKKEQSEIKDRYDFIQSLNPETFLVGNNHFSRYFGAKFDNGVVVLENVEYGNAVYIFHNNWEELTKLSRTELLKINHKDVTRILHVGDWKKKITRELDLSNRK